MQELQVALGERSYPIYVGDGLLSNKQLIRSHISGRQVLVVTNDTIAPLYLERVMAALTDFQVEQVILPDGEQYKNMDTLNQIFDRLLSAKHNRTTTLVALGGGVIGDMTGFAAACYQRGVRFIQVPTTLLAQVDSSVGGKTGVNHALGKNMIGAFHQPAAVIIDTATLATLPPRELRAGFAEVIKYGLICDPDFFEWLEQNYQKVLSLDEESLKYVILRSCANKAEVVAEDEREAGLRAILNLGHTFGHAIETFQKYGNWLHGEAVAAGMVMAADLSMRLGWIDKEQAQRAKALIETAGLPIRPPQEMSGETFLSLMAVDKKVMDGQLRLVLLKRIGGAVVTGEFERDPLTATLNAGDNLCR